MTGEFDRRILPCPLGAVWSVFGEAWDGAGISARFQIIGTRQHKPIEIVPYHFHFIMRSLIKSFLDLHRALGHLNSFLLVEREKPFKKVLTKEKISANKANLKQISSMLGLNISKSARIFPRAFCWSLTPPRLAWASWRLSCASNGDCVKTLWGPC